MPYGMDLSFNQGLNPCPCTGSKESLTTGPLGKSLESDLKYTLSCKFTVLAEKSQQLILLPGMRERSIKVVCHSPHPQHATKPSFFTTPSSTENTAEATSRLLWRQRCYIQIVCEHHMKVLNWPHDIV